MKILGVETSCDECSAAVVEDGRRILSQIIASQTETHRPYQGVVPELASRRHTELILPVVQQALRQARLNAGDLNGLAVTNRPGLTGSLLVGLSFVKAFSLGLEIPFIGVNHIEAHLYAAHLEQEISYPYLGLLVSGGHSMICRVDDFDKINILGATVDDACGEAFDKVAKHYNFGFPGGVAVDRLAAQGDSRSFNFPTPRLKKNQRPFDLSFSGLKTAVINQTRQFHDPSYPVTPANIAASFQKTAIAILLEQLDRAIEATGLRVVVAGGGVAANSLLRQEMAERKNIRAFFPSLKLCTDNGAMIAGLAFHYLNRGERSDFDLAATPRLEGL